MTNAADLILHGQSGKRLTDVSKGMYIATPDVCCITVFQHETIFISEAPTAIPSAFLPLEGTATSIIFVATKHFFFCRDNTRLSPQKFLSRQNTSFVATKINLSRQKEHVFVGDNSFVATSILLSRQKRVLSRQTRAILHV